MEIANIKKYYIEDKMTIAEISAIMNISKWKIRNYLIEFKIQRRKSSVQPKDLIGEKFGNLIALEPITENGIRKWKCQCACGNFIHVRTGHLINKGYTSCGCKRGKRKNLSSKWKGYGDISGFMWKGIYLTYKKNKKVKNFSITIDYTWDLFIKQNKKCAISGLSIEFAATNELHKLGKTTASLDRINSSEDYIEGNVQWVHKDVNKLKSDFNQKYFISLCKIISNHNREQ